MNEETHIDANGKVKPTQHALWGQKPPMKNTSEDFNVGDQVNVKRLMHDLFSHDFTGHVVEINDVYIIVADQDDDRYDCVPEQLSHSSDEIMHGN